MERKTERTSGSPFKILFIITKYFQNTSIALNHLKSNRN